jgi:hypothetical protein
MWRPEVLAPLAIALSVIFGSQEAAADPEGDALIACAPSTLSAAMDCLDAHWTAREEYNALPYEDTIIAHFGFGMWVRNNWGLWGGGPLAEYFNSLGINHPDNMSGIILTSYWLRSNGCPVRLDDQLGYYRAYWDNEEEAPMPEKPQLDCTEAGAQSQ